MRFGVGESAEYILEEVGRYFNITREHIRQVKKGAAQAAAADARYSAVALPRQHFEQLSGDPPMRDA